MAFEVPEGLMVSVSGVRGRVGESLTPEVAARFAAAFGAWATAGAAPSAAESRARSRVIVARDARTSGPMLSRAVVSALQAVGCDVIDLGLVPTPTALLSIGHHRAAGGIIVTASHNPVEWNALKLAGPGGMFLDAEEGPRMRAFVAERPLPWAGWDALGRVTEDAHAVERHLEAVLAMPFLDVAALRRRRFRVAFDAIRGAGAVLFPALFERLGCDVVGLNMTPDGRFPREPEPVAENLGELERLVRESGADLGLATDPDGDRLALVDEAGHAIGEDYTLALAAKLVLRHRTGPVVTNLSTSRVVEDVADAAGVPCHRAPVGEINVARRMEAERAVVGGEGNGGVILPDVQLTRDAAVAAALILQLQLETGSPVGAHVAAQPVYSIVKDKLPRGRGGDLAATYAALQERLAAPDADRQDGLRLAWPAERKWVHVRPSGTEPVLRIIAEAPSAGEARALVAGARAALQP
jgi:phosphomannomutase